MYSDVQIDLPKPFHRGIALEKRGTPKIGGSAVGFIVLIIVLVLIIVVSCLAILYLLRENTTPVEERRSRRQNRIGYKRQNSSSSLPHPATSSQPKSWRTRLSALFIPSRKHRHSPEVGNVIKMTSAGEQERVPAGFGNDWSDSVDDLSCSRGEDIHFLETRQSSSPLVAPRSILSNQSVPSARAASPTSDNMSLSVRFDLDPIRGLSYSDKFAPSPQSTLVSINSQVCSPSSSPSPSTTPTRTTSPEPLSEYHNGQGRQFATQSGTCMQTFEGGTKFREAL